MWDIVGRSFCQHEPARTRVSGNRVLRITLFNLVPDLNGRRRWLACFLGSVVLAVASALFLSRDGRKTNAPRIVVLATWYSNGEQLVGHFRLRVPRSRSWTSCLSPMAEMPNPRQFAVSATSSRFATKGRPITVSILLRSRSWEQAWEGGR